MKYYTILVKTIGQKGFRVITEPVTVPTYHLAEIMALALEIHFELKQENQYCVVFDPEDGQEWEIDPSHGQRIVAEELADQWRYSHEKPQLIP